MERGKKTLEGDKGGQGLEAKDYEIFSEVDCGTEITTFLKSKKEGTKSKVKRREAGGSCEGDKNGKKIKKIMGTGAIPEEKPENERAGQSIKRFRKKKLQSLEEKVNNRIENWVIILESEKEESRESITQSEVFDLVYKEYRMKKSTTMKEGADKQENAGVRVYKRREKDDDDRG